MGTLQPGETAGVVVVVAVVAAGGGGGRWGLPSDVEASAAFRSAELVASLPVPFAALVGLDDEGGDDDKDGGGGFGAACFLIKSLSDLPLSGSRGSSNSITLGFVFFVCFFIAAV